MPPRPIRTFADGTRLEYDRGGFDEWCVYLRAADGEHRRALRDVDYFRRSAELSEQHGLDVFFADFVTVYKTTNAALSDEVLEQIDVLAAKYGVDALSASKTLATLYATMVAEENKSGGRLPLKKRIKRLGLHQVLYEGMTPEDAAEFSRGKKVAELAPLCEERGF